MRQTTETFNDFKHAFIFQVNKFIKKGTKNLSTIMADIDDFFAKKDKKKKGGKKFAKANTDVIAKNLIETDK